MIDDAEPLFDQFEMTLDAANIDAQVQMRDDDLRGPRFFDADRFPKLVLRGGVSRHAAGDHWSVDGDLTIREVTRPVALDIAVRGMTRDARERAKAALTVGTAVQRSDFDLTTELREESGEPGSGPDVQITADVEAFLGE